MSKFWLFFGIILACTGIGTVVGIIMIIIYFWNDIKNTIQKSTYPNQERIESKFYDEDTVEYMR